MRWACSKLLRAREHHIRLSTFRVHLDKVEGPVAAQQWRRTRDEIECGRVDMADSSIGAQPLQRRVGRVCVRRRRHRPARQPPRPVYARAVAIARPRGLGKEGLQAGCACESKREEVHTAMWYNTTPRHDAQKGTVVIDVGIEPKIVYR